MKIKIFAVVAFEADTADADPDLQPVDQAHELALMKLPGDIELDEVLEWEPAS